MNHHAFGPKIVSDDAWRAMAEIAHIEAWNAQKYGPQDVAARARAAERGIAQTEEMSVQSRSSDLVPFTKIGIGPMGGLGVLGLGEGTTMPALSPALIAARTVYGIAGAAIAGYHGNRRNHGSTGWTVVWALFGFAAPIITNVVGAVEGYAKPAKR